MRLYLYLAQAVFLFALAEIELYLHFEDLAVTTILVLLGSTFLTKLQSSFTHGCVGRIKILKAVGFLHAWAIRRISPKLLTTLAIL